MPLIHSLYSKYNHPLLIPLRSSCLKTPRSLPFIFSMKLKLLSMRCEALLWSGLCPPHIFSSWLFMPHPLLTHGSLYFDSSSLQTCLDPVLSQSLLSISFLPVYICLPSCFTDQNLAPIHTLSQAPRGFSSTPWCCISLLVLASAS